MALYSVVVNIKVCIGDIELPDGVEPTSENLLPETRIALQQAWEDGSLYFYFEDEDDGMTIDSFVDDTDQSLSEADIIDLSKIAKNLQNKSETNGPLS